MTLLTTGSLCAQEKTEAAVALSAGYRRDIRPVLSKYCFSCHGAKKAQRALDLEGLQDQEASARTRVWGKVWDRVRSHQMPPPGRGQPTSAERERLAAWLEEVFSAATLDGHPDPGPLLPRRLNVREHMNSFRDLVVGRGAKLPRNVNYTKLRPNGTVNTYHSVIAPREQPCDFVARTLPQDTNDGGFDTLGENLSIQPFLMEKYLRCSKLLMNELFAVNARRSDSYQWPLYGNVRRVEKGPWPKGQTQRQALVAFLKDFASQAFRRPVRADEVEKYARLFDLARKKGEDFENSIRLPLEAILVSPHFVILWNDSQSERQGAAPVRPLGDYELATRLSLFLWSSLPDRELFQAAEKGRLRDPQVLEEQVRRMLRDRRIMDGLIPGFLCQWLQLDRLERANPDAAKYASYFQNNLGELMTQELLLFADAILAEDRSILEFVDADWGFLCYPLAVHYGVEGFPGKRPPGNAQPPWYRVKMPDKRRGGVLTMGKVLTGTSQPLRTSPVARGKWLLETVLGTPPPPPPPDVDNVLREEKEPQKALTVRQRMEKHRADTACASCHRLIDPLGMALETFDPVGRWRATDQGQEIDPSGELVDGRKFKGIEDLKTVLLSRKDDFTRAFVEHMLAYALGRKLSYYDVKTVREIVTRVSEDGHRFSRVVVEVAKSYPFRHRRVKEIMD
jgi:hypothetical protein